MLMTVCSTRAELPRSSTSRLDANIPDQQPNPMLTTKSRHALGPDKKLAVSSSLASRLTLDALILEPLSYLTRPPTRSRSCSERLGSNADQSWGGYS